MAIAPTSSGTTFSAFAHAAHSPTASDLRAALGPAYQSWIRLIALVAARVSPLTPAWRFGGAKYGWSLRLLRKDRVILYMTPREHAFLVSFALGEKAVAAAKAAGLAATVLKAIDAAPRYAEGRGVRVPVRGRAPLTALARLAQIKHEH